MTRYFLVASSLTNAILTISIQLIALAFLAPADFGQFSLLFLFYGLGLSVSHSLVIDVWVRSAADSISWKNYASVLFWLAICSALIALALATLVTHHLEVALLVSVGVGAGIYRNGSRFYAARQLSWTHVLVPDVLGCAVLLGVFFVSAPTFGSYQGFLFAWATSLCIAAISSRLTKLQSPRSLASWIRTHWARIRNLWIDSTLLDVSVIVTPIVMSGFMSPASFGIYRSISSAALPVRLLLAPLRPNISQLPLTEFVKRRTMLIILAVGAMLGAGVFLLLLCIRPFGILPDSILPHVADFAVPAGIFAFSTLVSNVYYVAARSNIDLKRVHVGRVFETVIMVLGPVLGLALAGTTGAVWLFAISAALSAIVWLLLVRLSARWKPRRGLPAGARRSREAASPSSTS